MLGFNKKKKILVAEDDPSAAALLTEFLKMQGYDTIWAKDGAEVIGLVEKNMPDLIFLDILMPKLPGTQVLLMLKARPKIKDIPVLMCSALNTMNEVEECSKSGALGYITKPYDLQRVIDRVKSILG